MKWRFWRRSPETRSRRSPANGASEDPAAPPTPAEIALAYHECTKHHPHRFARSLGYLDWDTQPDPFRRFEGTPRLRLPLVASDEGPGFDDLQRRDRPPAPVDMSAIASLLEFSLALSASKSIEGASWFLRINPSSGNLHPTEGYVVLGPEHGLEGPAAGTGTGAVLHYAPEDHALELRARIPPEPWASVVAAMPEGAFLVGLSSIAWRESWKYGERAYRYCQHDAGHALAALSYAAASLGWWMKPLSGCSDQAVAQVLGLDREADFGVAERERPVALAWVCPGGEPGVEAPEDLDASVVDAFAQAEWTGTANRLSPEQLPWEVIDAAATACEKPTTARSAPRGIVPPEPSFRWVDRSCSARSVIRERRSAVDLDGKARLPATELFRILERTLPVAAGGVLRPPFDALPAVGRVHLVLFVHRVDGLAPGLYAFVRDAAAVSDLRDATQEDFAWTAPAQAPESLPLHLLQEGDFRGTAASLCCSQAIAGSGVMSLGMLARFQQSIEEEGAWWYRWLHWEAGAIGQVLYLEAEAAGLRGTGIGCFFDDAVHGTLGTKDRRFQSLYHFTMGAPVDDPRLVTGSPYDDLRRADEGLVLE